MFSRAVQEKTANESCWFADLELMYSSREEGRLGAEPWWLTVSAAEAQEL